VRQYPGQLGKLLVAHPIQFFIKAICFAHDSQEDQKLVLKTLLFSLNVYAKKTTGGMSFLMESKKLLNLFQTLAAMSGNSTLQTMGDLSKNYDGVRIGLDTHK